MAYEKQTWINGSSKLNADRMNHIENGIEQVEKEIKIDAGTNISLTIDPSDYVMTLELKNGSGSVLSTQSIDLPLETMVVNATYDSTTKEIVLTLQNGNTTRFSVSDLISGLENTNNKTNTITSTSTNEQYPSAKAVYTLFNSIINGDEVAY